MADGKKIEKAREVLKVTTKGTQLTAISLTTSAEHGLVVPAPTPTPTPAPREKKPEPAG